MSHTSSKPLSRALAAGICAWAAYGTVETLLAVLFRALVFPRTYAPPSARFTLLLLAAYPAAGAMIGAAVWMMAAPFARTERNSRDWGALQSLFIAAACTASLAVQPGRSTVFGAALTVLIAVAAFRRITFVANPWMASLLLLTPPWLVKEVVDRQGAEQYVGVRNGLLSTIVVVALLAAAYVVSRTARRTPRQFLSLAAFAVATLLALLIDGPQVRDERPRVAPPPDRLPNIVLVVLDTVRADHLSLYGYGRRTTPRLEEFARTATVYERAYSPANATLPTHAAWFTGLWPGEHGAHFDEQSKTWHPLPSWAVTLPELLADRGYYTASVAANFNFLGSTFGLDRGFLYADARPPHSMFGDPRPHYLRAPISAAIESLGLVPATTRLLSRSAAEIAGAVRPVLDRLHPQQQRPFMLFVNFMDAHSLCIPPEPYASLFDGRDPRQPIDVFHRLMAGVLSQRATRATVTAEEERHITSQYDGAIAYEDAAFGGLMNDLRARGLYDNSLIIVASDHGEVFGARGMIGHGTSNYEDQIRVPLIVKIPGESHGTVIHEPVSTMMIHDLLAGTAHVDSVRTDGPIVAEAFPMQGPAVALSLVHAGRAIVSGRYKLIDNVNGQNELYDVVSDPDEAHDLSATPALAPVTTRLRATLEKWRASRRLIPAGRQEVVDPETLHRLRSLGYLH